MDNMIAFEPATVVAALVAVALAGLVLVLLLPLLDRQDRRKRRMHLALRSAGPVHTESASAPTSNRRKEIEKTLREIEEKQKELKGSRQRPTLEHRLAQAGLPWGRFFYWLANAAVGMIVLMMLSNFGLLVAVSVGTASGLALPHLYVNLLRRRRLNAFSNGFPDAIDVIVRGVRAGRPLGDCIAIVASDSDEPLRGEFRRVVEDQSVGLPVNEAVNRLAQRIPLQEVNFLAVVVGIQSRAGGKLTEALENLSVVLRGRRQLRAKVTAMSAEAKTSAGIIGSLPVFVAGAIHFTSPEYLAQLYQTEAGIIVLVVSLLWMAIGSFIMRQMINFDM